MNEQQKESDKRGDPSMMRAAIETIKAASPIPPDLEARIDAPGGAREQFRSWPQQMRDDVVSYNHLVIEDMRIKTMRECLDNVESLFLEARDTEWDEGVNAAKRAIASMFRASLPERASHCPVCHSAWPHLHPALQHGGEVELCTDDFHLMPTNQNRRANIDAVLTERQQRCKT